MDAHFSERGLAFLRALKRHNDRTWFNERKSVYETELKGPMLGLIEAINEQMLRWSPEHVRAPEKTMMRIYRDIRFSPDKRPYKTHVAAWWARTGMEKTSGAGFYLQVSGAEVMVAAGLYMPDREQLLELRRHLVDHHRELRRLLQSAKLTRLGFTALPGTPLSRPPKGFAGAAEALDLIQQREWGVAATLAADAATEATFAREVGRRFQAAAPLIEELNRPLLATSKRSALHF